MKRNLGRNWAEEDIKKFAFGYCESEMTRKVSVAPSAPSLPHVPNPNLCTLATLASHLPANCRKNLLASVTPLSGDELPQPKDLSAFWIGVEGGIQSIHPSIGLT